MPCRLVDVVPNMQAIVFCQKVGSSVRDYMTSQYGKAQAFLGILQPNSQFFLFFFAQQSLSQKHVASGSSSDVTCVMCSL
jgi:hypothetical protein